MTRLRFFILGPRSTRCIRGDADVGLLLFSAIGMMAVVYLLFFSERERLYPGTPVATLRTDGSVNRRHADSLGWENIGDSEPLYRKDIVYTPPRGVAYLEFTGHRVQLEPDSMIQLDDVTREALQITLFRGSVKGDAQVKRPKTISRPLALKRPRTTALLDPLSGFEALEQESAALDRELAALLQNKHPRERVRSLGNFPPPVLSTLDDYEIDLIEPKNQPYNLRSNKWLGMRWSSVPGDVSYELDVAKDAAFSDFLTYRTKSNSLSVQFEDPGTYFWRVRASRGGAVLVSRNGRFQMTEKGGASHKLAARLPSASLSGYTAEVSPDSSFSSILSNKLVDTPRCPVKGLPSGSYYCRLTPLLGGKGPAPYKFDVP